MEGATKVKTSEFADVIISNMKGMTRSQRYDFNFV